MKNFLELKKKIPNKPWLIVGKGPSFIKIYDDIIPAKYNIFGLNHVAKLIPTFLTSVIDIEVLDNDIISKSQNIIMPWHPHTCFSPSSRCLHALAKYDNALLRFLDEEGKLYWYNLSTWKAEPNAPVFPIIMTKFFSAEAAFQILGNLGVKEVFSVGLDGGKLYAQDFYDLKLKPLTNTQPDFDRQFTQIDKTLKKFGLNHIPL